MKTLKLLITGAIIFSFAISTGQVTRTRHIPSWGVPVTTQRYYYLPDIQTYYDIPSRQYVHLRNGNWVRTSTVPAMYRNYDFKNGRKVVINDYRGDAPYTYYNVHRVKYAPARTQQAGTRVLQPQTRTRVPQARPRVVNQEPRTRVPQTRPRVVNQEPRPRVVNQEPRPRVIYVEDHDHDHKHGKGHSKGKGKGHAKGHGKGHDHHGHGKGVGHNRH